MSPDSPFDRTERIPSVREQTIEPYLENTDAWVARCRARVLQLDAVLKTDEADALVWEMSQLERWRVMGPERVADQLYPPAVCAGRSDDR